MTSEEWWATQIVTEKGKQFFDGMVQQLGTLVKTMVLVGFDAGYEVGQEVMRETAAVKADELSFGNTRVSNAIRDLPIDETV